MKDELFELLLRRQNIDPKKKEYTYEEMMVIIEDIGKLGKVLHQRQTLAAQITLEQLQQGIVDQEDEADLEAELDDVEESSQIA